jgi:hypothetical protein
VHLTGQERGELDVEIDAVEERAGEAAEVSGALGGRTDTAVEGGAAAAAGVGGGNELKAGREAADAAGAGDRDAAVLEGLAQRLEHVLLEFGELV